MKQTQPMHQAPRETDGIWYCGDCGGLCTTSPYFDTSDTLFVDCQECGRGDVVDLRLEGPEISG